MTSGDTGTAGGPGGPGGPGMVSSAADKKRAATYLEQHQLPDTRSAGAMGEGGAGAAHGGTSAPPVYGPFAPPTGTPDTGLTGLSHWATDAGLSQAMSTWRGQVSHLMARLENELSALRGTNTLFQGNDLLTGSDLRSVPLGPADVVSRVGDL